MGPSVASPFPDYWIRSRASGNAYLLVQSRTGGWEIVPRTDASGAILVKAGKKRRFPYPPPSDATAILLVVTDKPAARTLGQLVHGWPTFDTNDRDAFDLARSELKVSLSVCKTQLLDSSPMPANPEALIRK